MSDPIQTQRQAMQLVMRELLAKKGVGVSTALDILEKTGMADPNAIKRTQESFKPVEQRGAGADAQHPNEVPVKEFIADVLNKGNTIYKLRDVEFLQQMAGVVQERKEEQLKTPIITQAENELNKNVPAVESTTPPAPSSESHGPDR